MDFYNLLNEVNDPLLDLNTEKMALQIQANASEIETSPTLHLNLQAGFPTEPLTQSYLPALKACLQQAFPSKNIDITLDFFIKAHRTQLPGLALAGVKNVIAIASGKGGVGKSTVTVNLAAALARAGARVGILDADIYGPSIPMMLGKHEPVAIQGERYLPVEAHGLYAMSIGYLMQESQSQGQALIWRGPMLAKSLLQMIDITLWDNLDYLFIDLPPGTGDIQLSLVQKIPLTAAIVVSTPQNIATLDAEKAIIMFEKTNIDVLGMIENMSYHSCSHCGEKAFLFGQGGGDALSNKYNIPLLGQIPLNHELQSLCDAGRPQALYGDRILQDAWMKTALKAAITLAQKPLNYAGKFPPIVVE